MAGGAGSSIGKGGMITKIWRPSAPQAPALRRHRLGREPDVLLRLAQGEAIGTLLVAQTQKTGAQAVDGGSSAAARCGDRGCGCGRQSCAAKAKPLPIGMMVAVEGDFARGDVIAVRERAVPKLPGVWPTMPAPRRVCCAASRPREFERLLGYAAEPKWCTATTWWCLA